MVVSVHIILIVEMSKANRKWHLIHSSLLVFVDISMVDVGNYTCEVGGPQNTVLASVTHRLFVRGAILSCYG